LKLKTLDLERTVLDPGKFPKSRLAEIAVSGRSNVGKSSLLNLLFARKNLARVSKQPGKTRTVNFFLVNGRFYMVDLPGYGFARVSKSQRGEWQGVIYRYIEEREALAGVIQLIDARHEPTRDDLEMLQRLTDAERSILIVLTKTDKVGRGKRAEALRNISECFAGISVGRYDGSERFEVPVIFSSAVNGEGKKLIWQWVESTI
jgi:GTP-binding protein